MNFCKSLDRGVRENVEICLLWLLVYKKLDFPLGLLRSNWLWADMCVIFEFLETNAVNCFNWLSICSVYCVRIFFPFFTTEPQQKYRIEIVKAKPRSTLENVLFLPRSFSFICVALSRHERALCMILNDRSIRWALRFWIPGEYWNEW